MGIAAGGALKKSGSGAEEMASLLYLLHYICLVFLTSVSAYTYDLKVSDIGAESVVLKWKTTESNVEEFRVHCSGIRHYITSRKEPHQELDVITHYVPGSLTRLLIGDVQPNYNYSCIVSECLGENAQVLGNKVSSPFHFTTDYSAPEEPRPPKVQQKSEFTKISLCPVSSKYGPILGYKVQFHVIADTTPDGSPVLQDVETLVPFGEFAPPSSKVAASAKRPKTFQLTFSNDSLPQCIQTDNRLLTGALKHNTKYSVVTIAFSKSKKLMREKSDKVLYSVSEPSAYFLAKGEKVKYNHEKIQSSSSLRPTQLGIAIAIGVVLPLLIICWVILIAVLLLFRARRMRLQSRKGFTREDVLEANKLRKAQRNNEMPWIQQVPMGDLPWLYPEQSQQSRGTTRTQSNPMLTHSSSKVSPTRLASKSLIQFSPEAKPPEKEAMLKGLTGYTTSEPTKFDISNFHKHAGEASSPRSNGLERIRSPTKFYSASEHSPEQVILANSSSSLFLPRGFSAGPQVIVREQHTDNPQPSPIQSLLHQLSDGESGQEDLAPDLEMDMFDISLM